MLHDEGATIVGPFEHNDFAFVVGEGHRLRLAGRKGECGSGFADFGVSVGPCDKSEKEEK